MESPVIIVPDNPGYRMIAATAPAHWQRTAWPLIHAIKASFAVLMAEERTVEQCKGRDLEAEFGCPVIPMLFDAVRQPDNLSDFFPGCDVITLDVPKPNCIWLWTPIDPSLYEPAALPDVDCLFLGRTTNYKERKNWLSMLPAVTYVERDDARPYREYASMLSHAMTCVNFCTDRKTGKPAMKGRVFEALQAGAILLEEKNDLTSQWLTPGRDYLEWRSISDFNSLLLELDRDPQLVPWLLRNARAQAARYNAENFWQRIESIASQNEYRSVLQP